MSHLYSQTELQELVTEGWPTGDDWADWVGTAEKVERDALLNPNIAANSYRGEINRVELRAFVKDVLDVWCQRVFPQMAEWERHEAIDSLRGYHDILVNWPDDTSLRHQLPHARPFLGSHVHDEDLDELVRRGETGARRARRHEARGLGPAPSSAARASGAGPRAAPVSRPRPRVSHSRPRDTVGRPTYIQRRQRRARLGRYKGVLVDSAVRPFRVFSSSTPSSRALTDPDFAPLLLLLLDLLVLFFILARRAGRAATRGPTTSARPRSSSTTGSRTTTSAATTPTTTRSGRGSWRQSSRATTAGPSSTACPSRSSAIASTSCASSTRALSRTPAASFTPRRSALSSMPKRGRSASTRPLTPTPTAIPAPTSLALGPLRPSTLTATRARARAPARPSRTPRTPARPPRTTRRRTGTTRASRPSRPTRSTSATTTPRGCTTRPRRTTATSTTPSSTSTTSSTAGCTTTKEPARPGERGGTEKEEESAVDSSRGAPASGFEHCTTLSVFARGERCSGRARGAAGGVRASTFSS